MDATTTTFYRTLGRSGIQVSALGLGCAATGGQFYGAEGEPLAWVDVDDNESIRAIHAALDEGVNFFDTADMYGAGHSEEVLEQAQENTCAMQFGPLALEQMMEIEILLGG
jgi:aryl-alcohol dehydrogenase-like predicted oxidoreductase